MILEFDTLDEMWLDTVAYLLGLEKETPSRLGGTKENLGFVARLKNPRANFMFNPVRKMSMSYAAAEILWYLQYTNQTEMMKAYAPQFKNFEDEPGISHGAGYGATWEIGMGMTQVHEVCKMLKNNKDTRQAVISMWDRGDAARANNFKHSVPCTLSLHFIVRENKLHLFTKMRSNDVWLGLPYDVFSFTTLQAIVANYVGVDVGFYQHEVSSMHLYSIHYAKAKDAIECSFSTDESAIPSQTGCSLSESGEVRNEIFKEIDSAIEYERHTRNSKIYMQSALENKLAGQLYVMTATKWDGVAYKFLKSKMLQNYYLEHFTKEKKDV